MLEKIKNIIGGIEPEINTGTKIEGDDNIIGNNNTINNYNDNSNNNVIVKTLTPNNGDYVRMKNGEIVKIKRFIKGYENGLGIYDCQYEDGNIDGISNSDIDVD